jgi:hypothetical protein
MDQVCARIAPFLCSIKAPARFNGLIAVTREDRIEVTAAMHNRLPRWVLSGGSTAFVARPLDLG